MYQHLGFRAPFIFGIILTVIDFIGRVLVIERSKAIKWGVDPWDPLQSSETVSRGEQARVTKPEASSPGGDHANLQAQAKLSDKEAEGASSKITAEWTSQPPVSSKKLTNWGILVTLMKHS